MDHYNEVYEHTVWLVSVKGIVGFMLFLDKSLAEDYAGTIKSRAEHSEVVLSQYDLEEIEHYGYIWY